MNPAEGQLDVQFPSAYQQLRRLAMGYLSRERRDHTLQPTALVHEAFLRLDAMPRFEAGGQEDVIRAAAHAMRLVLVDHARRHRAKKRSGTYERVPLDETILRYEERAIDLIALNDALGELARLDPRMVEIIELRFFAGLTEEEAAGTIGVSASTVRREWRLARKWLYNALNEGDSVDT